MYALIKKFALIVELAKWLRRIIIINDDNDSLFKLRISHQRHFSTGCFSLNRDNGVLQRYRIGDFRNS